MWRGVDRGDGKAVRSNPGGGASRGVMSEHTPGPWEVGKTLLPPHRINGIWSHDGMHVCSFAHCISIEPEYEVLRANANLMAAAPLMLAALESVEWSGEMRGKNVAWSCCPLCMGLKRGRVKPKHGPEFVASTDLGHQQPQIGHTLDCQLAAAIKAAKGKL